MVKHFTSNIQHIYHSQKETKDMSKFHILGYSTIAEQNETSFTAMPSYVLFFVRENSVNEAVKKLEH